MNILRAILAGALLFSTFTLPAQDVLDNIAVGTCTCLKELDRTVHKGEALQMQLGLCMMKVATPYEKELRKQYKVDMSRLDQGTGEKLGELVGMRLVGVCPEFLEMLSEMEGDTTSPVVEQVTATVTGVVTGLRDRH